MQRIPAADPSAACLEIRLRDLLVGHVCVVGVGNRFRSDDAAGVCVIDWRRPESQGTWIDAGVTPENHLESIVASEPDTILVVDAVDFGGAPGQCRLIDLGAMQLVVMSTHAGTLQLLGDYLFVRTGVRPLVLGIQPARLDLAEGLSGPVARSALRVAALLSDLLSPG